MNNSSNSIHSMSNANLLSKICEACDINTIEAPEQIPVLKEYLKVQLEQMKRELIQPVLTIELCDLRKLERDLPETPKLMTNEESSKTEQKIIKYELKSKEYQKIVEKSDRRLKSYGYNKDDERRIKHLEKLKMDRKQDLDHLKQTYWDKYSNLPISKGADKVVEILKSFDINDENSSNMINIK